MGGPAIRHWQEDRAGLPDSPNLPYLVCLQRVHLDIQVGEHANDYAEIAAKDKLSELQLRVRQLVEQVEQIQKEQWASSQRLPTGLARSCTSDSL